MSSLGPARDWDVFLSELLAPVGAARADDADLARLAEAAEAARASGYAQARAAIEAPSYTRYMLQLRHWIEARGWRDAATERGAAWLDRPIVDFAAHVLGKRQRKALKLGRQFAQLSAEDRHKVRIALKKLRYATEFFETLYPKKEHQAVSGGTEGSAGPPRPSQRRGGRRAADQRALRRRRREHRW